jgi:hypothetical protein
MGFNWLCPIGLLSRRYPTGNCRGVGENLEILALGRRGPACPQKGYETNET